MTLESTTGESSTSLVRYEPPVSVVIDTTLVKAAMDSMREFIRSELKEGVHYAKRGDSQKPSLEKPGAEVLFKGFRCRPEFEVVHREFERGQYAYYEVRCRAVHCGSEVIISEGLGACDTDRKAGGEDVTFAWKSNAALKMAEKSAMIAAALTLGCVSEFFTQDMTDERLDAPFAEFSILEHCPEHKLPWREGKYGPYHSIRGGGFCNLRDQLQTALKQVSERRGATGQEIAVWIKDHGYEPWNKLSERDKAAIISELVQDNSQTIEPLANSEEARG